MTDRYFTCGECGASFGSRRVLHEHNHKVHPEKSQKNPGSSPKDPTIATLEKRRPPEFLPVAVVLPSDSHTATPLPLPPGTASAPRPCRATPLRPAAAERSEEHTSELQSPYV